MTETWVRPLEEVRLGAAMTLRRHMPWFSFPLLALAAVAGPDAERNAAAEEVSVAEPAVRYPFDPVCPWGRVSDGRGMLVRCLEAAEAARLSAAAGPTAPVTSAAPGVAPAAAAVPRAPVAPASAPRAAALEAPPLASPVLAPSPGRSSRRVRLQAVGPAQADTGELPDAQGQLARASDRYVQCVENGGGISTSPAKVTLRFLVRERGRAEGVTVKDRSGVSLAAAKCIAEVVDRRFVGYPAAPIVGADVSIELVWEGAGR
jgi:hypothetical protein